MKILDRLEEVLIAVLMGAATLLVFVAVLHRYAAGWPIPVRAGLAAVAQPVLGAGALHLHVHLDGEVRRRLRRAHRHPRRRRRTDQQPARPHPPRLCAVRPACRRAFHHRRRDAGRPLRVGDRPYRPGFRRPRSAAVDRLPVHTAGLVSDVLSLSPGRMVVPQDRRAAASRSRPCRRPRDRHADRRQSVRHAG